MLSNFHANTFVTSVQYLNATVRIKEAAFRRFVASVELAAVV